MVAEWLSGTCWHNPGMQPLSKLHAALATGHNLEKHFALLTILVVAQYHNKVLRLLCRDTTHSSLDMTHDITSFVANISLRAVVQQAV